MVQGKMLFQKAGFLIFMQDKIIKKLIEHDAQFERIEKKLVNHDEWFEKIEKRLNQTVTKEEYLSGQDEIMKILERLNQERIFTNEWIKRTEKQIEQNREDIIKIKQVLNLT